MSDNNLGVKDEFFESMLADFLDESGELLEQLNENLLQLDQWVGELSEGEVSRCDEDLMNEMFRAAHSFKGLSGMLGLDEINNLTHKIENVFDAARNDQLQIDADVVELIFQSVDRLVGMVDCLKDPTIDAVDCEAVLLGIQDLLQKSGVERDKSSQEETEAAFEAAVREAQEAAKQPSAESAPAAEVNESESPSELENVPALEGDAGDELLAAIVAADVDVPDVDVLQQATEDLLQDTRPEEPSLPAAEEVALDTPEQADSFADIVDDENVSPKYLAIFIDESGDSIDELSEMLEGENDNLTEKALITCHRIKGSAASIGLNRAAKLAHVMEDLLQELQHSGGSLTPDNIDAMLRCADALRSYVDGLKEGNAITEQFGEACQSLLDSRSSTPAEPAMETVDEVAPAAANEPAVDASASPSQEVPLDNLLKALLSDVTAAAPEGVAAFAGQVTFTPGLPLVGLKASLAHERIAHAGNVFFCRPTEEEFDTCEDLTGFVFGVTSEEDEVTIRERLRIDGVAGVEMQLLGAEAVSEQPAVEADTNTTLAAEAVKAAPAPAPATKAAPAAKPAKPGRAPANSGGSTSTKPAETVRVDIDRLDQLMNLAGQLVINKARFSQIGDSLKQFTASKQSSHSLSNAFTTLDRLGSTLDGYGDRSHQQVDLEAIDGHTRRMRADLEAIRKEVDQFAHMRTSVNELLEAVHQLDRVSDGIQKSVMDTRMVPVGPLFNRFKRVIRDITRDNGKEIQLDIRGEKTELDKRMIDELGDPLIHMIRNSADHGVESPEDREAAGKPRQGTVQLDAFHRGNSIVIEVSDDGKGLDPKKIRDKAVEKGILSEADADKLTQHQMFQLIWEPGLSTAEKITQVSGRGMGMDIVRSKIEELSGTVELDSTVGVGTTITIKLPLTLAILPSLLADIHGDVFAMPVESVVEIVRVEQKDIATIHGLTTASVRGRVVSVVRLSELMTWNQAPRLAMSEETDEVTLVIVGTEGNEIGIVVHELLGEEDIVIKSMAENYQNVEGVAGASILGDGRVSLILDVGALLDFASQTPTAKNAS